MKIQDKIKAIFNKCAKIKFEGDSNDHPIIYLNILKNIIGDNKEKPSNTLMNKMIEISEEYPPRDKDEIFLSEIASEGLGMTVAVADLQDACQSGNWEEAKKVAARLQHVSENGLGLIEALIELSLQDFDRMGIFSYHLQRANTFNQDNKNNWIYAVCLFNELKKQNLKQPHKAKNVKLSYNLLDGHRDIIKYSVCARLWQGDYVRVSSFQRELSHWIHVSDNKKSTNIVNTLSSDGLDNYRKKRGNFFINLAEVFIEDLEALKFLEAFRFFVKQANEEEYYTLKKLLNN